MMVQQGYGARLGLSHDSGWSHLSHVPERDAQELQENQPMYGLDQIASAAVEATEEEMYGARRPVVRQAYRAGKRAHARRAARRDYVRGGWGSPGWQAQQGMAFDTGASLLEPYEDEGTGSDMLDEEIDAVLSESDDDGYDDEYGLFDDFGGDDELELEEDEAEDEFGRWGRGRGRGRGRRPRRPARRAFRRGLRAARRQHRRRQQPRRRIPMIPAQPSFRQPYPMATSAAYEEGPGYSEDELAMQAYEEGLPPAMRSSYGQLPVAAPQHHQAPVFTDSLKTGLGVGLGFLGAMLGVSLLSKAMR
jgi:hypothetical protein